jgi:hypothetical protein
MDSSDSVKNISIQDIISLQQLLSRELCYRQIEEEGLHVTKFDRFSKASLELLVDQQPRNLNKEFDECLNFTILDFMSAKINHSENEFKHETTNKFDSIDFSLDDFIRDKELKKAQKDFNTPKKSRQSKRKFST